MRQTLVCFSAKLRAKRQQVLSVEKCRDIISSEEREVMAINSSIYTQTQEN